MWPILAQTMLESGGTDLPAPTPGTTLPLIAVVLAAGYGLYRLSRLELLRRLRPYLLTLLLVLWALAAIEATFALAYLLTAHWFVLGLFMLAFLTVVYLDWFRDIGSAVTIAFEKRFVVGASVRIEGVEGEIQSFDMRSTHVRDTNGQLYEIPNHTFITESVANLTGEGDCTCEMTLAPPDHLSLEEARSMAREAALLTPLASPEHEPEVFIDREAPGGADHLRIRGYAFDPNYQEHYRSDVLSRVRRQMQSEETSQAPEWSFADDAEDDA